MNGCGCVPIKLLREAGCEVNDPQAIICQQGRNCQTIRIGMGNKTYVLFACLQYFLPSLKTFKPSSLCSRGFHIKKGKKRYLNK